jgi:hypothetical protein
MGKGGGGTSTTNTIQKSDPWGPQQAPLMGLYNDAGNQLNAGNLSPTPYPGTQVAPYGNLTNSALSAAGTYGLGGFPGISAAQSNAGSMAVGNDVWLNPAYSALEGTYNNLNNNPASPYLNNIAQGSTATPGTSYLDNIASGSNTNPYLNQTYNQAANALKSQLGGVFEAQGGGVTGSNYGGTTADALQNLATNIYGNAYENNQNRALSAAGTLNNNALGAAGSLGTQYNQGGLVQSMTGNDLSSTFSNAESNRLGAISQLPTLASTQMAGIQGALGAGQTQDQYQQNLINAAMNNYYMQGDKTYQDLARYAGLINGNVGSVTSGSSSSPYYSNPVSNVLGAGLGGLSLYNGLSSAGAFGLNAGFDALAASTPLMTSAALPSVAESVGSLLPLIA